MKDREPIVVAEKPDRVSWDTIQNVVYEAHANNRASGIKMRKPSLSSEEIRREIGEDGVMLVAIDRDTIVGTSAILSKEINSWYHKGMSGYLCYVAILPSYSGRGIYRKMCEEIDIIAKRKGMIGVFFDSHHKNKRMLIASSKNGYKRVGVRNCGDHWNVVMFKWLDKCPYSNFKCCYKYVLSLIRLKLYRLKIQLQGRF